MARVLIGKKTDIPEGSIVNITAGGSPLDILVANLRDLSCSGQYLYT